MNTKKFVDICCLRFGFIYTLGIICIQSNATTLRLDITAAINHLTKF